MALIYAVICRAYILCLFSNLFLNINHLRILFTTCGSKQPFSLFSKKKKKTSCVGNCMRIAILNNFSKVFVFIIYNQDSQFLKYKLSPSQHDCIKSKSTVTNLVTFVHFIIPSECSQGQTHSGMVLVMFRILPHALLYHKLNNYGLSFGYLNWFLSYLTSRQSRVHYSAIFTSPYVMQSGVIQGSVLGPLVFNIFINYFL